MKGSSPLLCGHALLLCARYRVGVFAQTKQRCIDRVVGFAQVKEEPEGRGTRSKTRYPIDTNVTLALTPSLPRYTPYWAAVEAADLA